MGLIAASVTNGNGTVQCDNAKLASFGNKDNTSVVIIESQATVAQAQEHLRALKFTQTGNNSFGVKIAVDGNESNISAANSVKIEYVSYMQLNGRT